MLSWTGRDVSEQVSDRQVYLRVRVFGGSEARERPSKSYQAWEGALSCY